jgi:ATP synthase I chain
MMAESLPNPEHDDAATVLRRIRWISVAAWALFAVFALFSSGFRGFVGLTCSALVTIISFLWLEEIVDAVLQPTPHLKPWKVTLRTMMRYALLGAAVAITIVVARFNALSVLLGFSVVIVGIIGEAVYSTARSWK